MKRKKGTCAYINYPDIKTISGWVIDYKGEKILIPYMKEKCIHEFVHIRSGIGFSGLYTRDITSLIHIEGRMAKHGVSDLFLKTLQAQDDLSINVTKFTNREYKSIIVNYKKVLEKIKRHEEFTRNK